MMKLMMTVNGKKKEVEVYQEGLNLLSVKVDGRAYSVSVDLSEQATTSETSGIAPASGVLLNATNGIAGPVPIPPANSTQSKEALGEELTTKQKSIRTVKSPLPGVVASVEVRPGQRVEKGALLMYIESMKMLNDIVSPSKGRVVDVIKTNGETVNIGDPILVLEEDGE